MYTNLFLQGPRGIGKSSLLRSVLEEVREQVAGYFVQRLFHQGEHVGFRLVDVESGEPYSLNVEMGCRPWERLSNVIVKKTAAGTWEKYPQVFATAGVQILQGARTGQKRLVLLDELGDIELAAPQFLETVHQLLASEKRVLGVLKLSDNPFLKGIRERTDVLIYDLEAVAAPAVRKEVEYFVRVALGPENKRQRE